ncbi:MAG: apolipoprotein N-acyltransferase, partial [Bryobacteraceae bacterium]
MLNYLLAVLTGVLLAIIHPSLNLWFLAPVAIAPLVYALACEWRPKHRFLLGYASGFTFWAGINYWIQFVISVHGGVGALGGTGVYLLFCVLKALHLGVFGLLAGVLVQKPWALLSIPALWVAIEFIPGPFYYTWLTLGNAGLEMGWPMRLAPYTGAYGLSYVFALLGTATAWAMLGRSRRELIFLAQLLVMPALPALPAPQPPPQSAVAVQPNIGERDDWTAESVQALHNKLDFLSLASALDSKQSGTDLILWPEIPAPVYYYDHAPLRDKVQMLARLTRSHILMGTVAHSEHGLPLNSALFLTPDGQALGRYDKMFLVPFGEYTPFPFKGIAGKVSGEIGDFAPGQEVKVFPVPGGRIAPFICYESAQPQFVRRLAAAGATVLANLSNDGYFGASAARPQHLNLVRMRAAENRRWILRATNDGITAAIDSAGRVRQTFPPNTETSGRLSYAHISQITFYSKHGDIFAWCCILLAAA